jgi:hypothetical protein
MRGKARAADGRAGLPSDLTHPAALLARFFGIAPYYF